MYSSEQWDAILDDLIDEQAFQEHNIDRARGGGVPKEPRISAGLWQPRRWDAIMRRLRQWGVRPETIGTEQPQVTPRRIPAMIRRRGRTPRLERWTTARNQPDIQAVDPRSGRRIAVEVDTSRAELERKKGLITSANPNVRAAFELIDPRTGRPVETHVWDPLSRRFSVHAGGLQRRDVLEFDQYELDLDVLEDLLDDRYDVDAFSASFRIRQRLPKSRIFPVTSGTINVTSSARWDRPSACQVRQYTITPHRVGWVWDDDFEPKTFVIPGTTNRTWSGLPQGDYYLEIFVGSSNPECILLGNVTVT
jgi:hypothetical protein